MKINQNSLQVWVEGLKKPDLLFYNRILEVRGLSPTEVLFIGDSIKLDIEPAITIGLNALLIDRINLYSASSIKRIKNLNELINYL